ncbi:LytR C-terminal domain-containing protein [Schaalia vaccimaxillae]|uniref:LytR C-terminal domain-containing protein n=1 Tax=Schaalia vaccimaxillae TaxID=183916 RepID=UPI0003B32665|nr:LytR C-terminal domain-containing protein [Schaalia vaccimaxillae]
MSPRQRFLKERQRKQNLTFAVLGVTMAVLFVLASLVFSGLLPVPFGNEFNKKIEFAAVGDLVCPSPGAMPVDPASVKVQVLNTTSRQGIASQATQMLIAAGYTPVDPGNSVGEYAGTVEINAGPKAVNAAYTLARFFPNAKVILTEATDDTVFVMLGTFYDGALNDDDLKRIMETQEPLTAPQDCLYLESDWAKAQEVGESDTEAGSESDAQKDQSSADQSSVQQSGVQSGG